MIRGKAPRPSYLLIDNDRIELRDASHLWGKQALEAEETLKNELGHDYKMVVTGVAGENQVPFSCVCSDYYHQAGRGGAGAVMGSKNIKAVAIKGDQGIPIADSKAVRAYCRELMDRLQKSKFGELRITYGTTYTTVGANTSGFFPTRNFSQSTLRRDQGQSTAMP